MGPYLKAWGSLLVLEAVHNSLFTKKPPKNYVQHDKWGTSFVNLLWTEFHLVMKIGIFFLWTPPGYQERYVLTKSGSLIIRFLPPVNLRYVGAI